MSAELTKHIPQLETMKQYPSTLFYKGDLELLSRAKVAIVGTRRPSNYTRQFTYMLANAESLEKYGDRVYEAELEGMITIQNGMVRLS